MKIIYRSVIAAVVVAVIVIAIVVSLQPTNSIAERNVKVSAILSLTGDFSPFGNAFRQGIEIAADELNEKDDIRYGVIFEDDGNVEVRKAVEASRKLINVDKADISLVTAANEGKTLSNIFESEKTPLIVLFDANKELEKGNYTFSLGFSTEGAAKSMAEFAYNNLSVRNVSVVYSFDDWSKLIADSFRIEFEALGGKVVLSEGTESDEKDFRTLITKSQYADAIYAPLLLPSNLVKQSRELGYTGYVYSADGFNQEQINAAGNAAEGVYHTNVYVPGNERLVNLIEKYNSKYGKEPEILELTAIGYDAMHAIDAAVRAKGIGREQIKEGLYEINIEGATGGIDFDETGMSPRFERIFIVRDGKPALVE